MSWLAHMVGGPLHGVVEAADGYWPFVVRTFEQEMVGYHLTYSVIVRNAIAPYTPLVYLWDGLKDTDAQHMAEAYIALHASAGGLLADYELTRLSADWFATRES